MKRFLFLLALCLLLSACTVQTAPEAVPETQESQTQEPEPVSVPDDAAPVLEETVPVQEENVLLLEPAEEFGAAVPEASEARAAFAAQADQWGVAKWVRAETPLVNDGLGRIVLPLRTEDGGIASTETEALVYDPDTGLVTPRYYAWRLLNENWKEASCGAVQTLLDHVLLEVDRAFVTIPAEAAQWEIAIGAEQYNGGGISFPQFRPPLGRWEPGQTYVLELDGIQRATLTATLPGQDPYSFCFQRLDTSQLSRTQPERLQARLRTAFTVAEWTEEELDRLAERLPDLDDWMTDTVWILEREPDQLLLLYVNQEDRMEVRDMDGAVHVLPKGGAEWLMDPSQIEPWLGATVDEDWWSREGAAALEAFAACLQTAPEVLEYNPVWRVEMLGEEVWLYLFSEWDGYFNYDLLIWQSGQEVRFAASGPLIRTWYLVYD